MLRDIGNCVMMLVASLRPVGNSTFSPSLPRDEFSCSRWELCCTKWRGIFEGGGDG
jgi:hypothetical protein